MATRMTKLSKFIIIVLILGVIGFVIRKVVPDLVTAKSKTLDKLQVEGNVVSNVSETAELPLPEKSPSREAAKLPLVRMAGYAWNGQSALIVANGGPHTTKGSLMEQKKVNLEIVRQDWLSDLRNLQLKFIEHFDRGKDYPEEGVFAVIIMGDGGPFYLSTTQQSLNDKYGDKYHLQVMGAVGLSYGEDKLIGPVEWKEDPQLMKGSLISAVLGDGDWVLAVNYAFANGLKVNPDPTTYDADAVNFFPSQDDDYMNSAKELIKSQNEGWTVPLTVVKNGIRTKQTINKKIDACATWTPGDKTVFDALTGYTDIISTKEFPNQMATTIIGVKEWAMKNVDMVTNILAASYTAANQMKQYDSWRKAASECVYRTFEIESPDYWYKMFQGQHASKGGVGYNMGGTRVFTYGDAKQYYGLGGDNNKRYKAVYEQVSNYLTELNPGNFNGTVKTVVPYADAVNMLFINNLSDIDEGSTYTQDYSKEATDVLATGQWHINFTSGSANLKSGDQQTLSDLRSIYNLLVQAEQTKLSIIGYTDNVGDEGVNLQLSAARAATIVNYLKGAGISQERFQEVEGHGESEPIADNRTALGRAENRRVQIKLLQ